VIAGKASAVAAATGALASQVSALALAADDPALSAVREFQAIARACDAREWPDDHSIFDEREQALQALGRVVPTTLAGAALLLATVYADEEHFIDANSPVHGVIRNLSSFLTNEGEGR
jgi:hypothetical protein